ncbi:hypothetical protein PR202_gb12997 [Eleusine coracana subsp. coracana]|uniref:Disease resistance N-terminal domain-containing protein n=1 Tax=Eleusine coracana subsp. coracana TaxID=191504 RepID=A0AAV5EP49_ELECO|nr:hypothetical protein PR202_gb12997 [Eleusine coracana subsp. coracana]
MATILDSLIGSCVNKLQNIVTEESILILGVKDDLKGLQSIMRQIQCFVNDAEQRRIEESAVNNWLGDLKDVMYEADDIIDLARLEGSKLLSDHPTSSRNMIAYATEAVVILLTTRNDTVARVVGVEYVHRVELMSNDVGWELLWKSMNISKETEVKNLRDIGLDVVRMCGGLPLAIKVIASALAAKERTENEWKSIINKSAWSMKKLPEQLRGALYLSYDELPRHLKQCFLYCALYPEDSVMYRDDLIRYWIAEGITRLCNLRRLGLTGTPINQAEHITEAPRQVARQGNRRLYCLASMLSLKNSVAEQITEAPRQAVRQGNRRVSPMSMAWPAMCTILRWEAN